VPPPPATIAVRARPSLWYAGVGLVGTSILDQSGGPQQLETGGGVSAWVGLNLSRVVSLELGWLGSFHNPATVSTWYGPETDFLVLEGVTADAKVHLMRGPITPYLQGGVGVYSLSSQHGSVFDSVGPGYQLGGGVDLAAGPFVTFGLRALYRGIAMTPPHADSFDTMSTGTSLIHAATFEASVAFHF
jgi:hypothetical protein